MLDVLLSLHRGNLRQQETRGFPEPNRKSSSGGVSFCPIPFQQQAAQVISVCVCVCVRAIKWLLIQPLLGLQVALCLGNLILNLWLLSW